MLDMQRLTGELLWKRPPLRCLRMVDPSCCRRSAVAEHPEVGAVSMASNNRAAASGNPVVPVAGGNARARGNCRTVAVACRDHTDREPAAGHSPPGHPVVVVCNPRIAVLVQNPAAPVRSHVDTVPNYSPWIGRVVHSNPAAAVHNPRCVVVSHNPAAAVLAHSHGDVAEVRIPRFGTVLRNSRAPAAVHTPAALAQTQSHGDASVACIPRFGTAVCRRGHLAAADFQASPTRAQHHPRPAACATPRPAIDCWYRNPGSARAQTHHPDRVCVDRC